MPLSHPPAKLQVKLAAALATSFLALPLGAAGADSSQSKVSFKPAERTKRALLFELRELGGAEVLGAEAKLRLAPARGRSARRVIRRELSTARVARAVDSDADYALRRRPRAIRGATLELTVAGDSDAAEPVGGDEDLPLPVAPGADSPVPTPDPPQPEQPEAPAPETLTCAVEPLTMTAPGCSTLRSDTASATGAKAIWGSIDCATEARVSHEAAGGDPAPTAAGTPQPDDAYRRLSVLDGDDVWGERCELGRNDHLVGESDTGRSGTFSLYREGDHKLTFFSQRYPEGFQSEVNAWQTVFQNKQAQPYVDDGNAGVALELQIYGGRLHLATFWNDRWSTPAPVGGEWVRYALDVVYSDDPEVGSVKLYVDRNADGDWLDAGEESPRVHTRTLATERSGSGELAAGEAIPSHARVGVYHDRSISCPPPTGCPVEVDNFQVLGS